MSNAGGACINLDGYAQVSGEGSRADSTASGPLDIPTLTRRMAAGDETAYRIFYDAYFNRLFRYLLVVVGGNEDATRDALQAMLVRVVRHVRIFESEAAFWSWLTVLARSSVRDQGRRQRRYLVFLDRFTRHAAVEHEVFQSGNDVDEQLRAALERHVALLSPDERQLVERKYFARLSVQAIAVEQQTTAKAVESKLSRVRRKLKEAMLAELKHEPRD